MSTPHNYSSTGSMGRRTSGADVSYMDMSTHFSGLPNGPAVNRPTSSLAGAMDESAISVTRMSQPTTGVWDMTQINGSITPFCPGFPYSSSATTTAGSYSPDSLPSASSSPRHYVDFTSATLHSASDIIGLPTDGAGAAFHLTQEIRHLRDRVRQLEDECRAAKAMIYGLPPNIRPSPSPRFQAGWEARTVARKKIYCSPNRAGNALCAWHDSRRERRVYPPRDAPEGFLNCGCSHEEALFEESLSRHGVGSYHPGDAVRMDPALRNPLLKLLEERYGYKDGDFDLDLMGGTWMERQSPEDWQRRAQEGKGAKARN